MKRRRESMSSCFPCLPLYLTFLQGPFEHVISKSVVGRDDVNELKQAIKGWDFPVRSYIPRLDEQLSLLFEGLGPGMIFTLLHTHDARCHDAMQTMLPVSCVGEECHCSLKVWFLTSLHIQYSTLVHYVQVPYFTLFRLCTLR